MNSAAGPFCLAADAARQVLEGSGARGTFSNLAAGYPSPLAASAGRGSRHSGPTLSPGVTIPAGPTQVAASPPGGGGLCAVEEAPANPSAFDAIELDRIAAAYPPEAAGVPVWTRERYFTPIQRAAWEQRFGTARCAEMSGQMQEEIEHG